MVIAGLYGEIVEDTVLSLGILLLYFLSFNFPVI